MARAYDPETFDGDCTECDFELADVDEGQAEERARKHVKENPEHVVNLYGSAVIATAMVSDAEEEIDWTEA